MIARPAITDHPTAVFVAPPCWVTRGRQRIFTALFVNASSLALLDQMKGHPRFYRRTRIALEDGAAVETYLLAPEQVEGRPVIDSGNWRARRKETAA